MNYLINALLIVTSVGIGMFVLPIAAGLSVALLLITLAVLWMVGVHLFVSRFLHGTEPNLFPIDEPLDDPVESPMR